MKLGGKYPPLLVTLWMLLVAAPSVGSAATITVATYSSLSQSSPFCVDVDPCQFLVVTLEDGVTGTLGGLSVDYFADANPTPIASDALIDELSNDSMLLSNIAIFLAPISDTATSVSIVAAALTFTGGPAGTLFTTPLLLTADDSFGTIQLVEADAAVPEPATILLVGPAAAALVRRHRRRRRPRR